ncbi:unnamed protein product [Parajaminaea phylloscopi]
MTHTFASSQHPGGLSGVSDGAATSLKRLFCLSYALIGLLPLSSLFGMATADAAPESKVKWVDWQELSEGIDKPFAPGLYANLDLGKCWEVQAEVWRNSSTVASASKRQCVPFSQTVIETERLGGGDWWTPWEQVGSCMSCDFRDGMQSYELSRTRGWSFSGGVSMSYGSIKSVLPNPAFGFSYQDTVTYTDRSGCDCKGTRRACVWMQNRMLWVKLQQRSRHVQGGCGVPVQSSYGPWVDGHADLPTSQEPQNFHFGCSTGDRCNCE